MSCKNICRLCNRLIISESVTFADGALTINIPAGSYVRGCKYCIVVAQAIPAETTITAPVVITIGDSTETYPLLGRCCQQILACGIRTRTRYETIVVTDATGGSFRLLGQPCCSPNNSLASIDGTAPAEGGGAA